MGALFSLLLFAIPAAFGITSIAALQLFKEKVLLTLTGTIVGLALITIATYLTLPLHPLGLSTIGVLLALCAIATAVMLAETQAWQRWRTCDTDRVGIVLVILMCILFAAIAPKLLFFRDGSLHTGIINAYGDIGWHVANITNLVDNRALAPENPIFAGESLSYPFLANLFSAILLTVGLNISGAVVIPALILIPLTLTLLYCLVRELTDSKVAGVIAMLLFLFGGAALGWLRLPEDIVANNKPLLELLTNPPHSYTGEANAGADFHLINPVFSMLLPQRAFLFGMPLAFTIILLLHHAKKRAAFIIAGITAGIVPLFHAHTALAIAPVIVAFALINWKVWRKQWQYFLTAAVITVLPAFYYYTAGIEQPGSFFHYQLGWMATGNWLIYWLKNTGLLVPTAIIGLFLPAPRAVKALAVTGLALFAAANIWLFAIWEWDNTKMFVYWMLFTLPLISWVANRYLQHQSIAVRGAIAAVILFHLISGGLDILHLTLPDTPSWQEWDKDGIAIASQIREVTQPGDTIITAPIHNSPVALSGRPMYLGYPGHVWTHGGSHWQRETAIKSFFSGKQSTPPGKKPQYTLIGPAEVAKFGLIPVLPDWKRVAEQGRYTLYQLPSTQ